MAQSLLAHLYPYIKGSQEDIATFSLQYLLSQSNKLNAAFTRYTASIMEIELDEKLQYLCQVVDKNEEKDRPDMAGRSADGTELVLFEMKFYASLTSNQPNTYLERLRKNGGKGLLFICPTDRRTSLWAKLQELCIEATNVSQYCVAVNGIKLAITTWNEVLGLLKQVASTMDSAFVPDIIQLEGYCRQIDSESFIPFSEVDLSAKMAKLGERYYTVVDEVIEQLVANKSVKTSKKGLKATAYRRGYTRSLYFGNYTITFNYDREMWKDSSSTETPFWVAIRDHEWNQTERINAYLKTIPDRAKAEFWGLSFLAMEPLQNATFTEVCENLTEQILHHIEKIDTVN